MQERNLKTDSVHKHVHKRYIILPLSAEDVGCTAQYYTAQYTHAVLVS